jgi:hypothetical protein
LPLTTLTAPDGAVLRQSQEREFVMKFGVSGLGSGRWLLSLAVACAMAGGVKAGQTIVMTEANVRAVLAAVRPGDTIRMEGEFNAPIFIRDRDLGGVTFDARNAVIRNLFRLQRSHNIHVIGGQWYSPGPGDAIRIEQSSHISFAGITVFGDANRLGAGVRAIGSSFVTLRDGHYEGLRNGAIFNGTTDSISVRNHFSNGGEDGMKVADSQRIILAHNRCTGFVPSPGYHPDCLQLWSLPDRPVQSDIYLLNNLAIGPQQSFVSFTPVEHSGSRLTFVGNYAATTSGHTITCTGCKDSLIADNMLVVLPDAPWRALLKASQDDPSNIVVNNAYFDLRGQHGVTLPEPIFSSFVPSIAGLVGSRWDDRSFGLPGAASSAPEPSSWAMLVIGFGLAGAVFRRRARRRPGCAA